MCQHDFQLSGAPERGFPMHTPSYSDFVHVTINTPCIQLQPPVRFWVSPVLNTHNINRSKQSKQQLSGIKSTERAAAVSTPACPSEPPHTGPTPVQPCGRGQERPRHWCRGAVDCVDSEQHVNYNNIYFSPFPHDLNKSLNLSRVAFQKNVAKRV